MERWTIRVENRRPTPARVIVRDRLPVSRHADIKVVDVALSPEPAERDELGRLEWVATVAPDRKWEASIRFGVEYPKEALVAGWQLTAHERRRRTCSGRSSSTLFTPISCMVRVISPVRICTALATPRCPPAISPYR